MIFVGALIFGMGVCYFWPTMIGFVAENLPKTGAVGLNLMGGAGMFAVSLYLIFMGGYYNNLVESKLPAGVSEAEKATLLIEAKKAAGPEIINITLVIPIILVVAFTGLVIYMKNRKKA
jgi:hypothetical protein